MKTPGDLVPIDAACAHVPRGDDSVRREHESSAVMDAGDQPTEGLIPSLASAIGFACLAPKTSNLDARRPARTLLLNHDRRS